jgi:hypothetical protein
MTKAYQAWQQRVIDESSTEGAANLAKIAQASIRSPGKDTKILPGKKFDGILLFAPDTFNFPAKVLFYDVVTETDAAGNPLKRENFDSTLRVRLRHLA